MWLADTIRLTVNKMMVILNYSLLLILGYLLFSVISRKLSSNLCVLFEKSFLSTTTITSWRQLTSYRNVTFTTPCDGATTLSIMTFSILTLNMKGLYSTLSVAFYLLQCWKSLCYVIMLNVVMLSIVAPLWQRVTLWCWCWLILSSVIPGWSTLCYATLWIRS